MRLLPPSPVPPDRRWRVLALDGAITLALAVLAIGSTGSVRTPGATVDVGIVLAVAATLALAIRRLWPRASAVVIGVSGAAFLTLCIVDHPRLLDGSLAPSLQSVSMATLMSLYAVTAYSSPRLARAAFVVVLTAGLILGYLADPDHTHLPRLLMVMAVVAGLVVGVWSMGRVRRARNHELEMLAERNRALEAEQEATAEQAATAERSRIAREMHDIVAHSLSAIIAQADGGRYAARSDPATAVRALETISTTSRQALADMRSLLGVLREDEPRDTAAPRGIDDLDGLVDRERELGSDVTLTGTGTPVPLPAALGLTVFRIAQESLTNARVHQPPGTRTELRMDWSADLLTVTVESVEPENGRRARAAAIPSGGRGIVGMRERATLHGGTLVARPTASGFRVTARLPLPTDPEEIP